MDQRGDVTVLLDAIGRGTPGAAGRLFPVVYAELRDLARSILSNERPGHTLAATALVHEAYVKLVGQSSVGLRGRTEFFGVAAQAMRRILVDHARGKNRLKRGGGVAPLSLIDPAAAYERRGHDLVCLDEALTRLAAVDERKARLVELRFFGGLTMDDAAALLQIPLRTAERDWRAARAWLRAELEEAGP